MKYCALYTLLLPLVYVLGWVLFRYTVESLPPAGVLTLLLICYLLPALLCNIGWLWVQRRPILSAETPYICFALPLIFTVVSNIVGVHFGEYDGINTIIGHVIIFVSNALCIAGIVAITALVWLLKRCR